MINYNALNKIEDHVKCKAIYFGHGSSFLCLKNKLNKKIDDQIKLSCKVRNFVIYYYNHYFVKLKLLCIVHRVMEQFIAERVSKNRYTCPVLWLWTYQVNNQHYIVLLFFLVYSIPSCLTFGISQVILLTQNSTLASL